MRGAKVFVDGEYAGDLLEIKRDNEYAFEYIEGYKGASVSLEMPTNKKKYTFDRFPPFFEGLLPEGIMLEGLLRIKKIDRNDYMSQIIAVGGDLVGNVTVEGVE